MRTKSIFKLSMSSICVPRTDNLFIYLSQDNLNKSQDFIKCKIDQIRTKATSELCSLQHFVLVDKQSFLRFCCPRIYQLFEAVPSYSLLVVLFTVNVPHQPDWLFERPYLTLDFVVGVDEPTDTVSAMFVSEKIVFVSHHFHQQKVMQIGWLVLKCLK